MYWVNGLYTVTVNGVEQFQPANPAAGVPNGTQITADWLNDVQTEILNVVIAGGKTPVPNTPNQMLAAIKSLIASAVAAIVGAPYDIGGGAGGTLTASQVVLYSPLGRNITVAGGEFALMSAPTAAMTFIVTVNGAEVATINFAAANATGAINFTSGNSFSGTKGQVIEITAPSTPDTTAAGAGFTLIGTVG